VHKIPVNFITLVIYAVMMMSCSRQKPVSKDVSLPVAGPQTIKIERTAYADFVYVSADSGSDREGDGSALKPLQSLGYALKTITDASRENKYAVCVSVGEYKEETLQMKAYVDLYGGFSKDWKERDIWTCQSILSGQGKRRVLQGADDARLDGFIIQNGVVRGHGGALLCDGVSPVVTNNVFQHNRSLKPLRWKPEYWHETANDGGAVYCKSGSAAVFTFNLFVENSTENGRGAGIAFHDRCKPVLANNVFLNNTTGLDDPMRSSDGGAVSVFDHCQARLDYNIFAGNKALASNDAGGVFIALWSSAQVNGNLFLDNEADDDAGALFVGGQEHRYDAPLDPIPPAEDFFVSIGRNIFIGNRNRTMNSGALRFTMESRGEFYGNYTAFNNGVYFQRSEVLIAENIFLDPVLLTETKTGLKKSTVRHNSFNAGLDLRTAVTMENNFIRRSNAAKGLSEDPLRIGSAGRAFIAASATYYKRQFITSVTLPELDAADGELNNRVLQTGNRWAVIKSNLAGEVNLWGNYSGQAVFYLLPVCRNTED